MKFGGTSVAKHLSTIVETIVPSENDNNRHIPILVCSAQSYTAKAEGTTQRLLDAIDAAIQSPASLFDVYATSETKFPDDSKHTGLSTPPPTPPQTESPSHTIHSLPTFTPEKQRRVLKSPREILDEIYDRHCAGAKRVLLREPCDQASLSLFSQLEGQLRQDCDRAVRLLAAVQMLGEISGHARDKIVSIGELMACRTVVAALRARGFDAHLVDLTDLSAPVDLTHNLMDHFVTAMRQKLLSSLASCGGTTPVLVATGFFGQMHGSLLDVIGRGYTDVCAALCARAVAAGELQIWKEVDGVFSADPRKITNARLLPKITSAQAKLLTAYGSEVIHHRAIDQAVRAKIPIVVRNVVNPAGAGTRVETDPRANDTKCNEERASFSAVFAVTILNDLQLVDAYFSEWELSLSQHPLSLVLDIIQDDKNRNLSMDLVTSSQDEVTFVISDTTSQKDRSCSEISRRLEELKCVASVTISPQMSYLQAVFNQKDRPAASIEIMKALAEAQIDIAKVCHRRKGDGIGFMLSAPVALKAGKIVHDTLMTVL
ncbi:hypothetical protein H0H92_000426 [Tricholoma furcatifolium]|nr:hypothetical protein H0H92_000426 [Tricholoma furcatifolium]